MKFEIYRTSDTYGEKQPCDGAVLERVIGWGGEELPLDTRGEEVFYKHWTIEVGTIEELISTLIFHHKRVIVRENEVGIYTGITVCPFAIEIYDDWRE